MEDKIHADEIGDISVSTTVATIQLMAHSPTDGNGANKPNLVHRQTLVMPMDAFLRGAGRMRSVLEDLERKGVIALVAKGGAAKK
jgi:hypothetical protein